MDNLDNTAPNEEVVVARIGRPHGLRGEVALELRTDSPADRFVPGARFRTEPMSAGPLEVASVRRQPGPGGEARWIVGFTATPDRTAAEALRGVLLLASPTTDPDAWYRHDLVGLRVQLSDGTPIGQVVDVEHLPGQDLLVIHEAGQPTGERTQVPLVSQIVPEVDVAGGKVVLTPPVGLLARDAQLGEGAIEPDSTADSGAAPADAH